MERILDFLNHFLEKQDTEEAEWKSTFIDSIRDIFPEVLGTADRLGIDVLTSYLTNVLANSLRNKSPGDIRTMLSIPSNFDSTDTSNIILFDHSFPITHFFILHIFSETQLFFS